MAASCRWTSASTLFRIIRRRGEGRRNWTWKQLKRESETRGREGGSELRRDVLGSYQEGSMDRAARKEGTEGTYGQVPGPGLHRQLGWQWRVLGLQLPWSLPAAH